MRSRHTLILRLVIFLTAPHTVISPLVQRMQTNCTAGLSNELHHSLCVCLFVVQQIRRIRS